MTKRELAEEVVENYALGHAGTALLVGTFGGQFGADRIALTALTVKMVNELCDIYGSEVSSKGRAIHIASAIGRLTVRGTVIAHTILNYIPFVGPAANSATTFYLTRKAGYECIRDIETNRMNLHDQFLLAGKRAAALALSEQITEAANAAADEIIEAGGVALDDGSENLIELTDSIEMNEVSTVIENMKEILLSDEILNAEKDFVSLTVNALIKQTLSGEKIDVSTLLKNNLVCAFLISTLDRAGDLFTNYDSVVENQLPILKKVLPDEIFSTLQIASNSLVISTSETRKDRIKDLIDAIEVGITLTHEGKAFTLTLCNAFKAIRFRNNNVPFGDGGTVQARRKLAYFLYRFKYSNSPKDNWLVSKRILFSLPVAQEVACYVRDMSYGSKISTTALEKALSTLFNEWGLRIPSENFLTHFTLEIVKDTNLLCAWVLRLPLISSYTKSCETASYGVYLHCISTTANTNWLLSQAYADILSRDILTNEGSQEIPTHTIQRLMEAVSLTDIKPQPQAIYEKILQEELFIRSVEEMAVLIAADGEANRDMTSHH